MHTESMRLAWNTQQLSKTWYMLWGFLNDKNQNIYIIQIAQTYNVTSIIYTKAIT